MQTTQINTISCKNGGKGAYVSTEWLEWTKYTPTGKEINEKGELYMLVPPSPFINAIVEKFKKAKGIPETKSGLTVGGKKKEFQDKMFKGLTCFFFNFKICCSTLAISLSTRSILWINSSLESLEGEVSWSSPMCNVCPPGDGDSTLTVNGVSW